MTLAVDTRSQIQGITCIVVAMVLLSLQDLIIKWVSGDYPLHQVIFSRSIVAIAITVLFAHLEGGVSNLKTKRLGWQLTRGVLLVIANVSYFLALAAMPLADAAAIFFIAPLMITALAVPFLGERVGPNRWFAVFLGLIGVVIMLRPGSGVFQWVAVLPVIAAFTYALMLMITRRIGITDRASTLAFWVQLTFFVASGLFGLFAGDGRFSGSGHPSLEFLLRGWTWPGAQDLVLFLACGALIGIVGYLISQAYRIAEANVVAPFEYVALPMAVFWGFLVWGDLPDGVTWLGMSLIVGGGMFVFYRETVRGRLIATKRPMPRNR